MNTITRLPSHTLGYLGLIPFALSALAISLEIRIFNTSALLIFVSYSAIILSFLSGVMWGNSLNHKENSTSRFALLLSNFFALLAWFSLLHSTDHYTWALVALMLGFICIRIAEIKFNSAHQDEYYQQLRNRLTTFVCGLHAVVFAIT
ncbi:DUF3429 domain-containing protein [Photobacterium sp. GB-27]|uniref:DUF3429 domain-containing protein n=1 Tax=unclassified Photobacterium TaxID=2628852 RepID=UPI000D15DB8F|nr:MULTISPECIES: DUF3429 domain-containing protein [unclassified Photobacterium]PSV27807.1 DUF3429 domain-containing protein [Photobacterium sp. GB-56]PSV32051.1 DUF3429 domain-containing protein [Photobacterium sp. GB-72]PSV32779.1 DUF3429 domain-containing protein [Photobacterium sp. GB-27]PSV56827.1 DUF3429 domain-containing protein [Photobacterium sp. GB-3]